MLRSEDPRTLKVANRQRLRYAGKDPVAIEFLDLTLERMNKGQDEHGGDYKERNTIGEIEPEISDCLGWFIMAGYKFRLPWEIQDWWFDRCLEMYRHYKHLVVISQESGIERPVKIANGHVDRVKGLILEDVPER